MKTETETTASTLRVLWAYNGARWNRQKNTLFKDADGRLFLGDLGAAEPSWGDIPRSSIEYCDCVSWRQVLEWFALVNDFAEDSSGDIGEVSSALLESISAERGAA